MTSSRESVGLSPKERSKVLAVPKKAAVTERGARADGEDVWSDVRDSTARGSRSTEEEEVCQPCGENITAKPAEDAPIRVARDPGDPTEEEFEKHCVTHLPYRRWCPICVKAKGKEDAHRDAGESTKPTIVLDYKSFGRDRHR